MFFCKGLRVQLATKLFCLETFMVYGIYLYTSTIWILKNRSTIHLLYLSSDHQIDVIHFDFEKAFDSVPHNEL